ncbi:MAG: DMT family transporter [Candidatus Competibacteraceae bacterium]
MTTFKLLLMALLWGGTFIAGRIIAQEVAPLPAAFYRFLIASGALWVTVRLVQGRLPRLTVGQWLGVSLLGLTGVFAYNYFFLSGLKTVPASRAALIVASNPTLTALVAWLLFDEPMPPFRALGIGLALGGAVLIIGQGHWQVLIQGGFAEGELLIFGCVLMWVGYTFIGRWMLATLSPLVATTYACLSGCLMLLLGAAGEGLLTTMPAFSPAAWGSIVFLGLGGTALAFTWYYDGVSRIGPAGAAVFINLVPVFAVLLSILLLGERPTVYELAGGILVVIGVALAQRAVDPP